MLLSSIPIPLPARNVEAAGPGRAPNASQNGVPWSEGRIPFQRIVSCLRQIASNIYLTKFTPQNASAKHYSTGERVYAARGLLGSDQQQFVVERAMEEKDEGADFLGRCGFPAILVPFFFFFLSSFSLLSLIPCSTSFHNRKSDSSPCETTMDDRESKLRFRNVKIKFPCLCSTGIEERRSSLFFSGRKI